MATPDPKPPPSIGEAIFILTTKIDNIPCPFAVLTKISQDIPHICPRLHASILAPGSPKHTQLHIHRRPHRPPCRA